MLPHVYCVLFPTLGPYPVVLLKSGVAVLPRGLLDVQLLAGRLVLVQHALARIDHPGAQTRTDEGWGGWGEERERERERGSKFVHCLTVLCGTITTREREREKTRA